ncbi:MAG: VCBS repeat-containing protein [Verrucomicrobiota bacterium]
MKFDDVDGNGLPDLFLCSQDGPNRLFFQTAPWKFVDVTAKAGITRQKGWSSGAAFVDVDNDGDLDLFVCNKGNHNELYRNQGNGTFKGGFVQQGRPELAAPTMAAFSDYDRDGDLDFYLTRTRLLSVKEMFGYKIGLIEDDQGNWKPHPQYEDEMEVIERTPHEMGGTDQLFEAIGLTDSGIPRYRDATKKAGLESKPEHGLAAVWWDANNDEWPDLYVSNDFHTPDHLYLNQQGGRFKEVTGEAAPYTSWSSMGSDFADINNDGLIDYLSTDMSATTHFKQKTMMGSMVATAWFLENLEPRQYMRNVMLVNTGTGRFFDTAQLSGIDSTDWTWSAIFGDLDHDGREDLFFTNGIERNVNDSDLALRMDALKNQGADFTAIQKEMVATPRHVEKNLAYRNLGQFAFEDVSQSWGLGLESVSHGAVFADLDRDGDLDLVVNNMNDPLAVYRNDLGRGDNSVLIELRGVQSNRFGLGARIVAHLNQDRQTRIITSSRGYMSGVEPIAHFGLGSQTSIPSLVVHWPSGIRQEFKNLAGGRIYRIAEAGNVNRNTGKKRPNETLFTQPDQPTGIDFVHRENPFDDFVTQPLLPNRLSRFGPAIASGDCDGDGLDDLFLGGASGQPGALFLQTKDGCFKKPPSSSAWKEDARYEDVGAVFSDLDGDGDLDLVVVSGGAAAAKGDEAYRDRFYRNDGKGRFERAPLIPDGAFSSAGCVAAADMDRDGDLDLFVGSRFAPGRYPHSETSYFLINGPQPTVQRFEAGLVTGAAWADVNGDGWVDLLLTREWGSPALFRNERGRLVEATTEAGFDGLTGWWNGLAASDVDGDGDLDVVATNFGLNTKYQPTPKKPIYLYAGDFAGNGGLRLIEAAKKENRLLPVRGKSCSTHAMPHLANKFQTYRAFAEASLTDIYTEDRLKSALRLEATTLASMLFLNDGQGRFKGTPLPALAQLSPGFGVILEDLDGDRLIDCFIAQNFNHPQRETGRMNAGLNAFLKGDGKGGFSAVWPKESGLKFRDDSRNAVLLKGSGSAKKKLAIAVNGGAPRVLEIRTGSVASSD